MEKRKGMIIGGLICAILAVGGTMAAIGYNQELEKPATQEAQTVTDADTEESVAEEPDMAKEQEASNKDEKKEKADKKEQSKEATTESEAVSNTESIQSANTGNTKPQTANTQPVGQTSQPTTGNPAPEQTTQPVTTTADTPVPEQTTQPVTGTNDVQTVSTTQEKNKVWVVDEPAWDETYEVYETRSREVCYVCGGYMYTQADVDNHPCFGGWYSEYYQVCVGTETEHHEEVGHWEWQ